MVQDTTERIDNIGFGNLQLIQAPKEFCYGVDAVLLADFAARLCKKHDLVFDLGTGTGVIPLILSHKLSGGNFVGVEVQEQSARRAERSVEINDLKKQIEILNCNIKDIDKKYFGTADVVVSNPPYMPSCGALKNKNNAKMIARHEIEAELEDFMAVASRLLKDKGELFMVHRPSRLVDIFTYGRKHNLEAKTLRMVAPKEGEVPNIVLVHFAKNGGKELKVLQSINVHRHDGEYTEEIFDIYEK